jgi:hypothetical protein
MYITNRAMSAVELPRVQLDRKEEAEKDLN